MQLGRSHFRCGASLGAATLVIGLLASGCAVDMDASTSQAASALSYDAELGNRVANVAARVDGQWSGNMCLKAVGDSLDAAGIRPTFPRLPGAVDLDNWARSNPGQLAQRGYQKQEMPIDDIPRGSIIAWRPGQCGYSSTYGHIEIAIGGNRACSDFCGNIARGCGAPSIYVPVGGGGGSGDGTCSVRKAEGKLYCTNRESPVYAEPKYASFAVDRLRTTSSWFTCWTTGELHKGGNTTWYGTVGDDSHMFGYVPAVALNTTSALDQNPEGLPKCEDASGGDDAGGESEGDGGAP